jgi:hypothetical protein
MFCFSSENHANENVMEYHVVHTWATWATQKIPTENQAIGDDEHGDFTRRTQQLDTPVVPIRIGNRNDVMG